MGQGCVNSFRPFCSSQACTPSSARDIWRVYQSGTSMTLFFCLPVTCLSAPWFPRLPKQDCNHKLVEPLNFSVCLPLRLLLNSGQGLFCFLPRVMSASSCSETAGHSYPTLPCENYHIQWQEEEGGAVRSTSATDFQEYLLKFSSFPWISVTLL